MYIRHITPGVKSREIGKYSSSHLLLMALCLCVSIISVITLLAPKKAEAATTITITSPTSGSAAGADFTVSGTATANRSIEVKVNGISAASTTSDGSGNWSVNLTNQPEGNKAIDATATGQYLYSNVVDVNDFFTSSTNSRMVRINSLTGAAESSFQTAVTGVGAPITWSPNPAFTKAYGVTPYLDSPTVWVMNLSSGAVTTFTLPGVGTVRGATVAYNTDATKVYIVDNANGLVYVYNTATDAQIGGSITVGSAPHHATLRPGTNQIWIPNSSSNSISVIDTTTDTVIQTYSTAGPPNAFIFSNDESIAYVGLDSGNIQKLNADTGASLGTITTSHVSEVFLKNDAGTILYASSPLDNVVQVINLQTDTVDTTIPVTNEPWGLALANNGTRLYVTSPNLTGSLTGTDISVIDTSNNSILNTLTPGNGAPFYIYTAPAETASTSITLVAASTPTPANSTDKLADTGEDTRPIALIVFCCIILPLMLRMIESQFKTK